MSERNERWGPNEVHFEGVPVVDSGLDAIDAAATAATWLVAVLLTPAVLFGAWLVATVLGAEVFATLFWVGAGLLLVAWMVFELSYDPPPKGALPIRIGPSFVRVGSQTFSSAELVSAHFVAQSLVLRFRDGTAWVSRPLALEDPDRVLGWIRQGILTQDELFDEVEAAQRVRRALDELRVEAAEFR